MIRFPSCEGQGYCCATFVTKSSNSPIGILAFFLGEGTMSRPIPRRKCFICDQTADLVACSAACSHAAVSCAACVTLHVEARFSAYGLQPIPCIAQKCKATLSESEVASNMSAVVRSRFSDRTFNASMMHEDSFVRCAGGCGCCSAPCATPLVSPRAGSALWWSMGPDQMS